MLAGTTRGSTRIGRKILGAVLVVAIVAGAWVALPYIEWRAPAVSVDLAGDAIGLRPFEVKVSDEGRGLRSVTVDLVTQRGATRLVERSFPLGELAQSIEVTTADRAKELAEGDATLRIEARDYSYWAFSGNTTTVERAVKVDLTAPKAEVLSRQHYVNFGGSAFVVYRTSEDAVRSGVTIGERFFPGFPADFGEGAVRVAWFAHPYDTARDARPMVIAEDAAGNSARAGMHYVLKDRQYRTRTIEVSDTFIDAKVLPLLPPGFDTTDRAAAYVQVNHDMRRENAQTIVDVCARTDPERLWDGDFGQLTNSQVEASFADERHYMYGGREIGVEHHLGYDLAVTRHYPIEAANRGRVVYAEPLGIYGNTVILDHGQGIHTLYAHLSSIDVSTGGMVEKGDSLGKSGETGLAGGDHLHYAALVHGVPVLPLEWWDGKWIRDNVELKIKDAKAELAAGR
jgi:murein DD-endopeptidase MepM/ murein hydrolase activator NlpD